LPLVYRSRAERQESPALAAFHWDGSTPKQNRVANLSSSGAFLLTQEHWNPGQVLSLTLQRAGELENSASRRFTVQAKAIRRDREGVAVAFLMPAGADLRLWHSGLKADMPQTEPEDVVREFRIAAAIAFIQRIAPAATAQAKLLFREGLSNFRLESAIEIALYAEELLSMEPDNKAMRCDPAVVLRILDDGSWAEKEWIQHFWSALLATSCTANKPARADLRFPILLSQLTTIQARLFAGSCSRSNKIDGLRGSTSAEPLSCTAEELIQIAGTHDRVHIERDIQQLVELGLIEQRPKWKFFAVIEKADITPTGLALELYARCHGHRGSSSEFYAVLSATTSMYAAG
jgi:hypothetical protein